MRFQIFQIDHLYEKMCMFLSCLFILLICYLCGICTFDGPLVKVYLSKIFKCYGFQELLCKGCCHSAMHVDLEKNLQGLKASTFLKIGTQWVYESKLHVFCKLCTFFRYSQVAASGLETIRKILSFTF